ncbi:MAG: hypothetical protein LBV51_00755 [Acholeplasmatales bacterium]|jgi:maltose phosphorylase|nr:hypothetical protein [Acholeplasmatales bacterium]
MGKIANKYFVTDPYKIIENGFDITQNQKSESIFSLGNEYMGIRGFFEEGINAPSLVGTYFNGVYEWNKEAVNSHYKGIIKRGHHMVNSCNFLYTRIVCDDENLDLAHIDFNSFTRVLDLKTGLLTREFVWTTLKNSFKIKIKFERIVSNENVYHTYQKITFEALNFSAKISVLCGLDPTILHWGKYNDWTVIKSSALNNILYTRNATSQTIATTFSLEINNSYSAKSVKIGKIIAKEITLDLEKNIESSITKHIINIVSKDESISSKDVIRLLSKSLRKEQSKKLSFENILSSNTEFYDNLWKYSDITIEGDPENQQGIRFCIFNLAQCYHGYSENDNIGAKGLTGEAYSGHAFWDTETYCLPYYLFNDPKAAKNLLLFRYHTLDMAKKRAIEVDCKGACYPIATLNGYESCDLWQHALTQIQPTTGVAYAIDHYVKVTNDISFIKEYGLEMLIEIARFLASRGDYNSKGNYYGYYGVMGPDEFQLMVNHDTYTNYMAKQCLGILFFYLEYIKNEDLESYNKTISLTALTEDEIKQFKDIYEKMYIIYDPKTLLYEQHMGYYDLPHIDIDKIPRSEFPLYSSWSYDRIYRNDMIKQPSVLMLMFLYNSNFSVAQIKANYDFYEPRTIHESSLSPSIHSILASQVGYMDEALKFFSFSTRLDLDDYNNNTLEGLHMTSIVAAWVNIVYGFGGLRSDNVSLKLAPTIPSNWTKYSFNIQYLNAHIKITVTAKKIVIESDRDIEEGIVIYKYLRDIKKGGNVFERE